MQCKNEERKVSPSSFSPTHAHKPKAQTMFCLFCGSTRECIFFLYEIAFRIYGWGLNLLQLHVIVKTGGQRGKGSDGPDLNQIQKLGYSRDKQKQRAKCSFPLKKQDHEGVYSSGSHWKRRKGCDPLTHTRARVCSHWERRSSYHSLLLITGKVFWCLAPSYSCFLSSAGSAWLKRQSPTLPAELRPRKEPPLTARSFSRMLPL